MSYKLSTYISLGLILILGVVAFFAADNFRTVNDPNTLGPDYYPKILAVALIILSIISILQTSAKKDKKLEFGNLKMVVYTILLLALFVLSWFYFGFFYIQLFIFLSILFNLYRYPMVKKEDRLKDVVKNLALALGTVLFIYILFVQILSFPVNF